MREILFRGKSKDTCKWVYGDLLKYADTAQIWEQTENGKWNCIIDPETLCQYTGLTDGNGRKVFEGDIFQADDGECLQKYAVIWNEDFLEWSAIGIDMDEQFSLSEFRVEKIDVIGNIFDNSELFGKVGEREEKHG